MINWFHELLPGGDGTDDETVIPKRQLQFSPGKTVGWDKEGNMVVNQAIDQLIGYGLAKNLIHPGDEIYTRNQLLRTLELDEYAEEPAGPNRKLHEILEILTEDAVRRGVCADNSTARELFDT